MNTVKYEKSKKKRSTKREHEIESKKENTTCEEIKKQSQERGRMRESQTNERIT